VQVPGQQMIVAHLHRHAACWVRSVEARVCLDKGTCSTLAAACCTWSAYWFRRCPH